MRARIAGAGHAVPGQASQEELWETFFKDYYKNNRLARTVFKRAGVETRHGVVNPYEEDITGLSTAERMTRYREDALPLAADAISECLKDAGIPAAEVSYLTVATCTGYVAPGIDVLVGQELGMPSNLQRVQVGHMGCYAALPALAVASDAVVARGQTAVVLCLELTSLHVQPSEEPIDREQLVCHSLFGDAAAAVALTPSEAGEKPLPAPVGLVVLEVAAQTYTEGLSYMSWDVTDLGFKMGLSSEVPGAIGEHVAGMVGGLLARHGYSVEEVAGWAIHPGGPEIIDVVAEHLGLQEEAVAASRRVLRDYGNCSSATILLILGQMLSREELPEGTPAVAIAFGPGLTIYAALLRASGLRGTLASR